MMHLPRCHYNKQHGRRTTAKRPFETESEAILYMEKRNLISKYNAYQCRICKKWHIGHKE